MANLKEKVAMMKELQSQEAQLYAEKNEKYQDAFGQTYAEYGPTVALVRLEDKLNRAKALVRAGLDDSNGESLVDTLKDLANYANMFLIELASPADFHKDEEKPKKKRSKKSRKEKADSETSEEGPLDGLTKKELAEVLRQLGGTIPKKANRTKLTEAINEYPKAQVAVAITTVKAADSEDPEGEEDGEEE